MSSSKRCPGSSSSAAEVTLVRSSSAATHDCIRGMSTSATPRRAAATYSGSCAAIELTKSNGDPSPARSSRSRQNPSSASPKALQIARGQVLRHEGAQRSLPGRVLGDDELAAGLVEPLERGAGAGLGHPELVERQAGGVGELIRVRGNVTDILHPGQQEDVKRLVVIGRGLGPHPVVDTELPVIVEVRVLDQDQVGEGYCHERSRGRAARIACRWFAQASGPPASSMKVVPVTYRPDGAAR